MMVKIFTRYLIILISCSILAACGKQEPGSDSLRILVQIPEGERQELFWFGVERKEIEIKQAKGSVIHPWVTGQEVELKLREGDSLVFRGYDGEGRLLVTGEAQVTEAKNVSIPLRRVL